MRFIGNKYSLVGEIYKVVLEKQIEGNVFFDFFSGTSNVGKFFKKKGYQVYSSDLLYFSYVLQKAYIENNVNVKFEKLLDYLKLNKNSLFDVNFITVIDYLNNIPRKEGFIYKNYTPEGSKSLPKPRMFFNNYNGKRIDAIRMRIEEWKQKELISENEYFVLLACLIEAVPFYANISGVYAAYQKSWDPRALKPFMLKPIEIVINKSKNYSYNKDSVKLLNNVSTDILYLDPPYNQRQYAPNYHLLETIAKYDEPEISGVAGLRDYSDQKSKFCNKLSGLDELNRIAKNADYSTLIMSYNSEGIIEKNKILSVLSLYGNVEYVEFDYLRYKSNSKGTKKNKYIKEQLFILKNER